jgi:hypothetical protein
VIEPGLTEAEFHRIESQLGFEFADDHRAFLAAGLPADAGWPNWRGGIRSLQKQMQLPINGILFAVEWNEFWAVGWGARPAKMKDALRSANYHLARAPKLVPVRANHYLPAGRGSSGHPVLSVRQAEVSICAADLATYLGTATAGNTATARAVEFWSDLIR